VLALVQAHNAGAPVEAEPQVPQSFFDHADRTFAASQAQRQAQRMATVLPDPPPSPVVEPLKDRQARAAHASAAAATRE